MYCEFIGFAKSALSELRSGESCAAAGNRLSLEDTKNTAKIDFSGDMHSNSKAWKTVWSAGQGVGAITKKEGVSEVIKNIFGEDLNKSSIKAAVSQTLKEHKVNKI